MGKFIQSAIFSAALLFSAGLASAHHVNCSQDLNGDGQADLKDTEIIDDAIGSKVGAPPYDERADINQDGYVNRADKNDYLHCVPPALDRSRRRSR